MSAEASNQLRRHRGGGRQASNSLNPPNSNDAKQKMNWFRRLRASKQDKMAASVQEHIRAVRAAEALDRQTARRSRSEFAFSLNRAKVLCVHLATPSFSEKVEEVQSQKSEEMVMMLARQNTSSRRIRIINILRRSFGEDIVKLPIFASIVNSLKAELDHYYLEVGVQTMFGVDCAGATTIDRAEMDLYREAINSNGTPPPRFTHLSNNDGQLFQYA